MKPFPQWKQRQVDYPGSTKSSTTALMNKTHQSSSQNQHRQQKGANPSQYTGQKAATGRPSNQSRGQASATIDELVIDISDLHQPQPRGAANSPPGQNGSQIQIEESNRTGPQDYAPVSRDPHYNTFDAGKQLSKALALQLGPELACTTDIVVTEHNEGPTMDCLLPSSPHTQTKLQKEGKHGQRQAGKSETHIDLRRLIEGTSQSNRKPASGSQAGPTAKHSRGSHSIGTAELAIPNPTNILRQFAPTESQTTTPQNTSFVKRPQKQSSTQGAMANGARRAQPKGKPSFVNYLTTAATHSHTRQDAATGSQPAQQARGKQQAAKANQHRFQGQRQSAEKPTYVTPAQLREFGDEVETRVERMWQKRYERQQADFMQMLQGVLSGHQNERAQLNRKIHDLGTQLRNLEDRLASEARLGPLHACSYYGGRQDTEGQQVTQSADQPSNLLSENTIKLDLKYEQEQQQRQRRLPQPLILIDEEHQRRNEILLSHGGACSPISHADDGQEFKVLSTREERAIVDELNHRSPKGLFYSLHARSPKSAFEEAKLGQDRNYPSPMPKLDLSALSHGQTNSRYDQEQEVEFVEKLYEFNRKCDFNYDPHPQSPNQFEDQRQRSASKPKFIEHVDASNASRHHSRNLSMMHNQSDLESSALSQSSGPQHRVSQKELTGRSENVPDTHRSSQADMRHLEQRSIRPNSRDRHNARGRGGAERHLRDAENAANDQNMLAHNCSRTHSLQQLRDTGFLSNYNQGLLGLSQSFVNHGPGHQTHSGTNDPRKEQRRSQLQYITAGRNEERKRQNLTLTGNTEPAGSFKSFTLPQTILSSPLSDARGGKQGYFGTLFQGSTSASNAVNRHHAAHQDQLRDPIGDRPPPDAQPNIPTEEAELPREQAGDSISSIGRLTKKANTRSASAHFQQLEGEIPTEPEEGENLDSHAFGQAGIVSPPANKALKHTHSSVGQRSRKLDLAAQQEDAEKTGQSMTTQDQDVGKIGLYEPKRWAQILNPQRCTCKSMPGPRAPIGGPVNNQMKSQATSGMAAQVGLEPQSVLSSPIKEDGSVQAITLQTSVASAHRKSIALSEAQEQLTPIADEHSPLPVAHPAQSHHKREQHSDLTDAQPFTATRPGGRVPAMVTEPCGSYCQWLTGERQRDIIRDLLTSSQGSTTLKSSNGRAGEKRFLINSVWWRKWTDYVNFDLIEAEQPSHQQEHLILEREKSRGNSRHCSGKKRKTHNMSGIAGVGGESAFSSSDWGSQAKLSDEKGGADENEQEEEKTPSNEASQTGPLSQLNSSNFRDELMSLKRMQSQETKCRLGVGEADEPASGRDSQEPAGEQADVAIARILPSLKASGATMRSSNTLNLYARPGPVENHHLLQKRNCMLLQPNLIEHHDYVALPADIWRHIYAWYSADWSIVRFLRKDSGVGVILDLYPFEGPEPRIETTLQDEDGEGSLATIQ